MLRFRDWDDSGWVPHWMREMLRLAVDTNWLMSWRKELGMVLEQEVRKLWEVLCIRWHRNHVFRFG